MKKPSQIDARASLTILTSLLTSHSLFQGALRSQYSDPFRWWVGFRYVTVIQVPSSLCWCFSWDSDYSLHTIIQSNHQPLVEWINDLASLGIALPWHLDILSLGLAGPAKPRFEGAFQGEESTLFIYLTRWPDAQWVYILCSIYSPLLVVRYYKLLLNFSQLQLLFSTDKL